MSDIEKMGNADLIAEAKDYLDRECNVSQFPNLVDQLVTALEAAEEERCDFDCDKCRED